MDAPGGRGPSKRYRIGDRAKRTSVPAISNQAETGPAHATAEMHLDSEEHNPGATNLALRKDRFRALVAKNKSREKFLARLAEFMGAGGAFRPVLFIGGWARFPGFRGGPPCPGSALWRYIQASLDVDVLLVDERYTSKRFYATGEDLEGCPFTAEPEVRGSHPCSNYIA